MYFVKYRVLSNMLPTSSWQLNFLQHCVWYGTSEYYTTIYTVSGKKGATLFSSIIQTFLGRFFK